MKKFSFPIYKIIYPLFGLMICILVICIFGKTPAQSLQLLFTGTFTNLYYFGSMLNSAAFLMIAGLGASLSMKCGNLNLGGEGQIYLGGFLAGFILSRDWNIPLWIQFLIALIAVVLSGALVASISALLKELRGAEVLLTTFLVSSAAIPLIDGSINSLKGNTSQNLLALPYIKSQFKFPQILPPSPLTFSFFVAIILCILTHFVLKKTSLGYKMKLWGTAPLFASYSGLSSIKANYFSLSVSGALHALTGMMAICGTYFTCHNGFYSGMGWNALSVALIASSNPLEIIPAALVLSWLYTSAGRVSLTQGFGFDIGGIIQGCILFALAIPIVIKLKPSKKSA